MPDKTYDILVEFRSKLEGFQQLENKLLSIRRGFQSFDSLMSGFAGGVAGGMVSQLTQIPQIFTQSIAGGLQFNATLEGAELGIAAIIKQFDQNGRFKNFDDALGESSKAIDLLKTKALQSPATFEQLVSAFQGVSGAASAANIPIKQQVDLVVLMSQALAGLGIRSEQILQESRALLTGNITEDAMAARILGITKAQVDAAKTQGNLFEFLTEKLSAFAEAGVRGQEGYTTQTSNLTDALTQLKGVATTELFGLIKTELADINAELAKPQTAETARSWGGAIADFAGDAFKFAEATKKELAAISNFFGEIVPNAAGLQDAAQQFIDKSQQRRGTLLEELGAAKTVEQQTKAIDNLYRERIRLTERLGDKNVIIREQAAVLLGLLEELIGMQSRLLGKTEDTADAWKVSREEAERIVKAQAAIQSIRDKNTIDAAMVRGDDAAVADKQGSMAFNETYQKIIELGGSEKTANEEALRARNNIVAAYERQRDAQQSSLQLTRIENAETERLRDIKARQKLIEESPFMSPDQKARALIALYAEEIAAIRQLIDARMADIAAQELQHGPEAAQRIEESKAKIRELALEMELLGQKAGTLSFTGNLQKELADWVNGFGTASQQIAGTIEGTINAALQGTNQLLLDAVFETGDWRQTLIGVERQILNLFLTWIEQMALQKVAELTGITTKTAAQTAANTATTASATPAAVAQTGASSGSNWIIGAAAAAVAIGAIIAAMSGAFARGGRTGRGPKIATVGEEGEEFVFTAAATENIGIANLYTMMHAAERAPRFGSGGRVNSGLGWELGEYPLPGSEMPNDFFRPIPGRGGPIVQINPYGQRYTVGGQIPGDLEGPFAVESGSVEIDLSEDYPLVETPTSAPGSSRWTMDDEPVLFDNSRPGAGAGAGAYVDRTGAAGMANYIGGNLAFGFLPIVPWWTMPGTAPWRPPVGGGASVVANPQAWDAAGNPIDISATAGATYTPGDPFGASAELSGLVTASGGSAADFTLVGRDSATGAAVYRDPATGRHYVAPGGSNSAGAGRSQADRFSRDSGTGNWIAGQTTRAFLLAGGYFGQPNIAQPDTRTVFDPRYSTGYVDEWGFIVRRPASGIPRGADGMRIPGPPSTTDTILAMLATGEQVLSAPATSWADRTFGRNFLDDLNNMRIPVPFQHFAKGGRAGGETDIISGLESGSGLTPTVNLKVIPVNDWRAALREREKDDDHRVYIVDTVNTHRHELGMPSAE